MKTRYNLQIYQLHGAYEPECDTGNSTPLIRLESDTPFGAICAGDSITDGPGLARLGIVSHVNHSVGKTSGEGYGIMQITTVYLDPEN